MNPTAEQLAAVLPSPLSDYASIFCSIQDEFCPPELLAALIWRESAGGATLKPPGPAGTGDFATRGGKLPPDGGGWGRGLGQIDFQFHQDWIVQVDAAGVPLWQVAESNISKAHEIFIAGASGFTDDLQAQVDSYNAGARAVRLAELQGIDPDLKTTGGNYGKDVLRHALGWHKLLTNGVNCGCILCKFDARIC